MRFIVIDLLSFIFDYKYDIKILNIKVRGLKLIDDYFVRDNEFRVVCEIGKYIMRYNWFRDRIVLYEDRGEVIFCFVE